MNSFFNRNIFTRKKFHKETQVDFSHQHALALAEAEAEEICLLKNKIKQLEYQIEFHSKKNITINLDSSNNIVSFGVDHNEQRYVKKENEYVLYY